MPAPRRIAITHHDAEIADDWRQIRRPTVTPPPTPAKPPPKPPRCERRAVAAAESPPKQSAKIPESAVLISAEDWKLISRPIDAQPDPKEK